MSLYNTTNIKNLPQVDQIIDTDFLVVENYSGTNKLKFKDFVVGPNNTSFYTSIKTNLSELSAYDKTLTTNVSSLSVYTIANFLALSAGAVNNSNAVTTLLNTAIIDLSAKTAALNDSTYLSAAFINARFNSLIATYPKQYHLYQAFKWPNPWPDTGLIGTFYFTANGQIWPYELESRDILFVRQKRFLLENVSFKATTLHFVLSTVFFNGPDEPSTYALILTSSEMFPQSFRTGYMPIGGSSGQSGWQSIEMRVFAERSEID